MSSKFTREAHKCLEKVTKGERARLDDNVRRGMIAELATRGVKVEPERADSYVAQRYVADTWSDEARAAALEARRANATAHAENTPAAHQAAAEASRKAAEAHRQAGNEAQAKGNWTAVSEHASAALAHSQNAQISAEKAGTAVPSSVKVSMPRSPVVPRTSPLAGAHQVGDPTSSPHDVAAEARAASKAAVASGKPEDHRAAQIKHLRAAEAFAPSAGEDADPGSRQHHEKMAAEEGRRASAASAELAAHGRPYTVSGGVPGRPQTSGKNAVPKPSVKPGAVAKANDLSEKARAASTKAATENTTSAHGEAVTANLKAMRAQKRAGNAPAAAEHSAAIASHSEKQRVVFNAKQGLEKQAREASPIHKAEQVAKGKSSEANKLTTSMRGGGSAAEHDKAASAHHYAKKAWLEVENKARAAGNEFKATAAHSYAEQHAVKGSDHTYSANALRSARSNS